MLSTNVAGRTKKSVISVVLFIAVRLPCPLHMLDTHRLPPQYCFGNAVGAQVFQAKWAPRYRPSTVILSIMFAIEFILMALWRIYCESNNGVVKLL
jgi:hypothetical protein